MNVFLANEQISSSRFRECMFGGQQRASATTSHAQEGYCTTSTGPTWDLMSSLRVANDGLKDLLEQERAPLPLLPNIMRMPEASLSSKRQIENVGDTASQQVMLTSTAWRNSPPRIGDRLDPPISTPQSIPDLQAFEVNSSLSDLSIDYQALFESIGLSNSHMGSSRTESSGGRTDDRSDIDEVMVDFLQETGNVVEDKAVDHETRCWDHGCNGKSFSTRSNLLRHQIEKGKARPNFKCPTCGAYFSRTTARNQHVAKKSCDRVRRYSNGRERPGLRVLAEP